MGSHITCMLFALHVLQKWPDDGQLTETCRQDKKNKILLLCLTETRHYSVIF